VNESIRTWQVELAVVAAVLLAVFLATRGGAVEAVGSLAVLASFAHGQVADRMAEHARLTDELACGVCENAGIPRVAARALAHCWRWSTRYFVAKELLWLVYFVAHRSWSALVGVGVFLAYPLWRKWWRGRVAVCDHPQCSDERAQRKLSRDRCYFVELQKTHRSKGYW
jgi:hypothetical protein